jgi:predicted ArsR family transcriptional regulator
MKLRHADKKFFDSTRGRIVLLLRNGERTVDELARELGLTDNGVRSHLATLERDGLITQGGTIKGFRKPHFAYQLTDEADELFPKPYDVLFNRLISELEERMSSDELEDTLREVGHAIASASMLPGSDPLSIKERLELALDTLASLGGNAKSALAEDHAVIQSERCPLSKAVAEHPEVCSLAESLLSDIVGRPVKEKCDRTHATPRCRFEISLEH